MRLWLVQRLHRQGYLLAQAAVSAIDDQHDGLEGLMASMVCSVQPPLCACNSGADSASNKNNKPGNCEFLTFVLGIILVLRLCCRLVVSSKRAKSSPGEKRPVRSFGRVESPLTGTERRMSGAPARFFYRPLLYWVIVKDQSSRKKLMPESVTAA
jgi:hypothetical protein